MLDWYIKKGCHANTTHIFNIILIYETCKYFFKMISYTQIALKIVIAHLCQDFDRSLK
jgi:hypothetical protein